MQCLNAIQLDYFDSVEGVDPRQRWTVRQKGQRYQLDVRDGDGRTVSRSFRPSDVSFVVHQQDALPLYLAPQRTGNFLNLTLDPHQHPHQHPQRLGRLRLFFFFFWNITLLGRCRYYYKWPSFLFHPVPIELLHSNLMRKLAKSPSVLVCLLARRSIRHFELSGYFSSK